jgi:hypothetical protein
MARHRTTHPRRCPECCEHGISLQRWCAWCAEIEEFGTCDFFVNGDEPSMPCEHLVTGAA